MLIYTRVSEFVPEMEVWRHKFAFPIPLKGGGGGGGGAGVGLCMQGRGEVGGWG